MAQGLEEQAGALESGNHSCTKGKEAWLGRTSLPMALEGSGESGSRPVAAVQAVLCRASACAKNEHR